MMVMMMTMMMIYNMMKCVFVCHEKSSLPTSELSAVGTKWAARLALPAVGRPWPSDYDDDDYDDDSTIVSQHWSIQCFGFDYNKDCDNVLTIIMTTKLITMLRWLNDNQNQNILIIIVILSGASTRKHDNKTAPGMKIVRLYRNQSFVLFSIWSINSISCHHVFCQRIIPGEAEMQHLKIDSF